MDSTPQADKTSAYAVETRRSPMERLGPRHRLRAVSTNQSINRSINQSSNQSINQIGWIDTE